MEVIIKEAGNRLDKALADLTELSRSQANEAIKAGTVLVNGKSAKAKYAVKEGDVITYELPEEEVLEYKAEDIPLDIIYEDADVAVVEGVMGLFDGLGTDKDCASSASVAKKLGIPVVLIIDGKATSTFSGCYGPWFCDF